MPTWLKLTLLVWLPLMVAGGLWFMSDAQVTKRAFYTLNDRLNTITETHDMPALKQFLQEYLHDDARVLLKVELTMLGIKSNQVLMMQDFDKQGFIRFMDLVLDPVASYSFMTRIEEFTPVENGMYHIATRGSGHGKATEMMQAMRVPMIYNVLSNCTTEASRTEEIIRFHKVSCEVGLGRRPETVAPTELQSMIDRAADINAEQR